MRGFGVVTPRFGVQQCFVFIHPKHDLEGVHSRGNPTNTFLRPDIGIVLPETNHYTLGRSEISLTVVIVPRSEEGARKKKRRETDSAAGAGYVIVLRPLLAVTRGHSRERLPLPCCLRS